MITVELRTALVRKAITSVEKKKPGKRYRMQSLSLKELSGVDHPAQEGAKVVLQKRGAADEPAEVERPVAKVGILTSSEVGHQHLLDDTNQSGSTSWEYMGIDGDYRRGHSHPWVKDADGNITIGDALEHGHTIATAKRGTETQTMTITQADLDKRDAEIKALKAELAKSQRYGLLSDEHKAHHATLRAEEADEFLSKSATARAADVTAALEADPVAYECADGTKIRKSHGAFAAVQARKVDELTKANAKLLAESESLVLTKRAETELAHLPKTVAVKVEVLRALNTIADEAIRKEAHEMLAAQSGALAPAFRQVGTQRAAEVGKTGEPVGAAGGNPEAQLDALAAEIAKEHKVDIIKAMDMAIETPVGKQLYAQLR